MARNITRPLVPRLWTTLSSPEDDVTIVTKLPVSCFLWVLQPQSSRPRLGAKRYQANTQVVPRSCPQRGHQRSTGTSRQATGRNEHASRLATDGAHDCAQRPGQFVEGLQTPRAHHQPWGLRRRAQPMPHHEKGERHETERNRVDGGFGRSRRKTGATLRASRLQHGTTSFGLHPLAKSMLFCTTTLTGLKCTFHASLLTSLSRHSEATPSG